METEEWRPIPDFEGYDVSDQGNVRSYHKNVGGEFGKGAAWEITDAPQRLLSPSTTKKGYKGVLLRKDGKTYNKKIASLVMLAFVGGRPEGMEVCHNDSNLENNTPSNLRYDTHQGNMNDRTGENGPKNKYVPVRIDTEDYNKLRRIAESLVDTSEKRGNISALIQEAVRQFLESYGAL